MVENTSLIMDQSRAVSQNTSSKQYALYRVTRGALHNASYT